MTRTGALGPRKRAAIVIALLIALKLWLVAWQQVAAEAGARFDDELFLRLAEHLKYGRWLGPYDELTLIKGPMYPLWIAAVSSLGLPLLTMQTLLHAAACVALLLALRETLPNLSARLWLFAALLFDPGTYDSTAQRVTREGIYTALTILLLAVLVRLASRPGAHRQSTVLWGTVGGLLLGAFWLTREEGPWIVPAVLLLLGFAAFQSARTKAGIQKAQAASFFMIPPAFATLCVLAFALINRQHYGVATAIELKAPWFESAYGALSRVGPENYVKWVPVPEPSRELSYAASPAFAELRTYLDGAESEEPASTAESFTLSRFGDMTGTWFVWALRDAAASAGHHTSLAEARRYYEQIAKEIDTACAESRIPCGSPRASLAPPLRKEYFAQGPSAFGKMSDVLLGMDQIEIVQRPSVGDTSLRQFYRDMTHSPVEGADPTAPVRGLFRNEILSAVRNLYALLLYPLTVIGAAGLLIGAVRAARARTLPLPLLVALAVGGAVFLRLALFTYISISSYPIYQVFYLRVLYPLVYLLVALGLTQFWMAIRHAPAGSVSAR